MSTNWLRLRQDEPTGWLRKHLQSTANNPVTERLYPLFIKGLCSLRVLPEHSAALDVSTIPTFTRGNDAGLHVCFQHDFRNESS